MSGTTAISGKNGKVVVASTLITRLTMWRLNVVSGTSAWGDSESEGFTNRIATRIDGTGSIGGKFDTNRKPYNVFNPGNVVTLALWLGGAAGASNGYYAFPSAVITSFDLEVNQDTQEVVGWTANFEADGRFYYPGQSGAPAYTLPSS